MENQGTQEFPASQKLLNTVPSPRTANTSRCAGLVAFQSAVTDWAGLAVPGGLMENQEDLM